MFIALRDMQCFGKPVKAGQLIPTPEKWDPIALQSTINVGWVKEVSESEAKRLATQLGAPFPKRVFTAKPGHVKEPTKKKKKTEQPENELRCCGRDFKNKRALSVHSRSHR